MSEPDMPGHVDSEDDGEDESSPSVVYEPPITSQFHVDITTVPANSPTPSDCRPSGGLCKPLSGQSSSGYSRRTMIGGCSDVGRVGCPLHTLQDNNEPKPLRNAMVSNGPMQGMVASSKAAADMVSMIFEAEALPEVMTATANADGDWIDVEFEVALDSGCTDNVCHQGDVPGYLIEASAGSRCGQ